MPVTRLPSPGSKATPSGKTLTSNSFSPAAGTLVVVIGTWGFDSAGATIAISSTGPAGTWNIARSISNPAGSAYIWWRYYATAPGAITITTTVTSSSGSVHFQDVKAYAGARPTATIGATVSNRLTNSSIANMAITTTTAGSLVVGAGNLSAVSGNIVSNVANWTVAGDSGDYYYQNGTVFTISGTRQLVTGTPGGTVVGWTAANPDNGVVVFVELLPEVVTEVPPVTEGLTGGVISRGTPAPPYVVQEALLAPSSRIHRRVEIYENDGVTPWRPELWDRLTDGSISVDYSRDERRSVELTLDNYDNELEHSPSNLWYDKIFKPFYGVYVDEQDHAPAIIIAEEYGAAGQAVLLKKVLNRKGFGRVRINTQAAVFADVADYDIVISIAADYSRKLSLLTEAYSRGKSIFTAGLSATPAQLPAILATADASTALVGPMTLRPNMLVAHPLNSGWTDWIVSGADKAVRRPTSLVAGATIVGTTSDGSVQNYPAIMAASQPGKGPRWVHILQVDFASIDVMANFENFMAAAMNYLDVFEPTTYWETQLGEFMPDAISTSDPGDVISITGRDYTKRCMLSKFVNSTSYAAGQNIGAIIRSMAVNSGITKFNLPIITDTLPRDLSYERSTERWKAMKEIADACNYEIYFDARGFMVMRKYQDPLLTPPTLELTSGEWGNLVSAGNKASDARLFNHVIVVGESNDTTIPPVAAEARNIQPNSPSSIQRIGDRVTEIKSSLVTTTAQAQELANTYLRVSSLEEFELDFSAILLPWIEVGEILEIEEERVGTYVPTRYLISSLSFPLDLGPMGGNGKRVTIVL